MGGARVRWPDQLHPEVRVVEFGSASLSDRSRDRGAAVARRRARGDRGVLRADGARGGQRNGPRTGLWRATAGWRSCPRRTGARLRGRSSPTWSPHGTPFVVSSSTSEGAARGRHRGRQARAAANGRRERGRGEVPRQAGRADARRDRLRLAGARARSRASARRCPASSSVVAYCRTRGEPGRVLQEGRRGAGREPPRRRRSRTSSSRSRPRRTRCCAASGCSRARSSARPARTTPRARELDNVVLERAVFVCCDSIEQAQARGGRPDRARRARRPRLARGARAPGGGRGRARRPELTRRHRRLQVERDRGVGRRDRRRRARAGARRRRSGRSSS